MARRARTSSASISRRARGAPISRGLARALAARARLPRRSRGRRARCTCHSNAKPPPIPRGRLDMIERRRGTGGGKIVHAHAQSARSGDGAFASKPTRSSRLLWICCANEACRRHTRSSGAEPTSAPRRPHGPGALLPPVLCRRAANAHSWMRAPRWRSRQHSSSESSNQHENIAQRAFNAGASGEVGLVGPGRGIAPAHGRQRSPCCRSGGPGAASVSILGVLTELRPRCGRTWPRGAPLPSDPTGCASDPTRTSNPGSRTHPGTNSHRDASVLSTRC